MLRTVQITEEKVINFNGMPLLLLCDEATGSAIPVFIGTTEANAIAGELRDINSPRPMTHDLFKEVLLGLGAMVTGLVVTKLDEEGIYHGLLAVERDGQKLEFDCRPSDGVALALKFGSPIQVDEQVFIDSLSNPQTEQLMDLVDAAIQATNEQ